MVVNGPLISLPVAQTAATTMRPFEDPTLGNFVIRPLKLILSQLLKYQYEVYLQNLLKGINIL
jgi:hypothetical protein